MPQEILIYTTQTCPFCIQAKLLLESKGLTYKEVSVDNPKLRQAMAEKAGRTSVPQIWIGETHVGGCDDLYAGNENGELERLLA